MTNPNTPAGWALRGGSRSARHRGTSVAGVSAGVGATTVAAAIGAMDRGVSVNQRVDILVCRASSDSLIQAAQAAQVVVASAGRKPVLAVNAANASAPSRSMTARLRLIEPHTSSVVLMPFVRHWTETLVPIAEIRGLLSAHRGELPRRLRSFASAALDLRTAIEGRAPASSRPMTVRTIGSSRAPGQTR